MATSMVACIDRMTIAVAPTLGRLVQVSVRYLVLSFRYLLFPAVALGWASATTTGTMGLIVRLRFERYFRWLCCAWRREI